MLQGLPLHRETSTLLAKIWKALDSVTPDFFLSLIPPPCRYTPVPPGSLVQVQYKCSPASGPLHMLFLLLGLLFPLIHIELG